MNQQTSTRPTAAGRSTGVGLGVALLSAASFGTSGTFGSSLIAAGWTPGMLVIVRIALAALILAIPTVFALRGLGALVRRSGPMVVVYGVLAVGGAQVFYFNAIQRLSVGVALMIEYLGIILVVLWMWLRHGQRPRPLTMAGSLVSVAGLALVLDLFGGVRIDFVGVLWGLGAAVGLAAFFVLSSRSDDALPPVAMASMGMGVGAVVLLVFGLAGVLPLHAEFADVHLGGWTTSWIVPIIGIAVIAAAFAYVIGIVAARMLGATMASFVGLTEVVFAVVFAWLLLDELPAPIQLIGGLLIVGGVALVRIDDLRQARRERLAVTSDGPALSTAG